MENDQKIIYNGKPQQPQTIYDAFNSFIISSDRAVFNKLAKKIEFYNRVKNIPGDIVECGVFKGTGMLAWLKIIDLYNPNSIKKVIGFDFFQPSFTEALDDVDKHPMNTVLSRVNKEDLSSWKIHDNIKNVAGFDETKFTLVQGDVSETSKEFTQNNVGFRISLLYLDMDIEEPTFHALNNFWDRIVPGGIVMFDEYAYHVWSESNAVDKFLRDKKVKLHLIDAHAPTAYIIKP